MTKSTQKVISIYKAFERIRARNHNVLIIVDGHDAVRTVSALSEEADMAWQTEAHKIAGVFNGDASLIDLRDSIHKVASDLTSTQANAA